MNLATILSYLYPLIGENLRITSYNKWIFVNFTKNHTFTHEKKADFGSGSGLAHIPEPIPEYPNFSGTHTRTHTRLPELFGYPHPSTRISWVSIPEPTPEFLNVSSTQTRTHTHA